MSWLNLWENSDKRTYKITKLQHSIKKKNPIWSLHIKSVGFTLPTLVIMLIVFVVVKHVNMSICFKYVWRRCSNCSDPNGRQAVTYRLCSSHKAKQGKEAKHLKLPDRDSWRNHATTKQVLISLILRVTFIVNFHINIQKVAEERACDATTPNYDINVIFF